MNNLIGQSLGRYHIRGQLGEGGMATVFKAFDTRLERDVAIKLIRREAFPPEQLEEVLKRFEREAKALARLSHPNIVKVLDYGEHDGAPFLVLEFLPGGTLKQKMGQPMPWAQALRLILPIAQALGYAHEQHIIHRDIKPANILLTDHGDPMLTDFGIAKILDIAEGRTLTASGVGVGTPDYMSPEQGMGNKVDLRADIYSLGIVLYELITGRKPYTADTPMAVVLKHMTDPLPSPTQFIPDLPEAVENILLKALAKHAEDRYQTMAEMVEAFNLQLAEATHIFPKPAPPPEEEKEKKPPAPDTRAHINVPPIAPPPIIAPTPAPRPPLTASLKWLPIGMLGIIGFCLVAVVIMGIFDICPPVGPWAQPPWCAGSPFQFTIGNSTPTAGYATLAPIHPQTSTSAGYVTRICESNDQRLCIVDVQTGQLTQEITFPDPLGRIDGNASWSPDGTKIVVAIRRTEDELADNDLYIYDLSNNTSTRLTSTENNVHPVWSPDGQWIAHHASGRGRLISADDQTSRYLTIQNHPQYMVAFPSWSPNSRWIAWAVVESTPNQPMYGIALTDMETLHSFIVEFSPQTSNASNYTLTWDPTGTYLYIQPERSTYRLDLQCLPTCGEITPTSTTDFIPEDWTPTFHPQWSHQP